MISEGFMLMFFGVSVVFIFLILMVIVINFTSVIIKFLNEKFPEKIETKIQPPVTQTIIDNLEEIAVVMALVKARTK